MSEVTAEVKSQTQVPTESDEDETEEHEIRIGQSNHPLIVRCGPVSKRGTGGKVKVTQGTVVFPIDPKNPESALHWLNAYAKAIGVIRFCQVVDREIVRPYSNEASDSARKLNKDTGAEDSFNLLDYGKRFDDCHNPTSRQVGGPSKAELQTQITEKMVELVPLVTRIQNKETLSTEESMRAKTLTVEVTKLIEMRNKKTHDVSGPKLTAEQKAQAKVAKAEKRLAEARVAAAKAVPGKVVDATAAK